MNQHCHGTTTTGRPCRNRPMRGDYFCRFHLPEAVCKHPDARTDPARSGKIDYPWYIETRVCLRCGWEGMLLLDPVQVDRAVRRRLEDQGIRFERDVIVMPDRTVRRVSGA